MHAFALMYVCMINQSLENCVIIAQLVLSISLRSRCEEVILGQPIPKGVLHVW